MRRALAALAALALSAGSSAAQVTPSVGVSLSEVRVRSDVGQLVETTRGPGLGLELAVRRRAVKLQLEYRQANLAAREPLTLDRDLTEGAVLLSIQPLSRLELATGIHRLHFDTDLRQQRWTMWEVRARGTQPLIADLAQGYLQIAPALSGSTTAQGGWRWGVGGEAGVSVDPPRFFLTFRLGYRIERYAADGGRYETADGLVFGIRTP